eukprot:GFUD01004972.1.p1 GENE.GFUD01004972.1~~GFUD01004972.1.p1  ORF type:complete len:470 (+),score=82.06 GFUD01004972.1:89-1498(+)
MKKLRTPNLMLSFIVIVCVLQTLVSPEPDIALNYLQKFGYILKPTTRTVGSPEKSPGIGSSNPNGDTPQRPLNGSSVSVTEAVKSFQEFAGLTATGELDEETLELMSIPRCGVEDVIPPSSGNSSKYQVQGSQWRKNTLSYRVTLYSQKMPAADVDADVKRAFNFWSAATNLKFFNKRSGDVDIEIGFFYYNHGDGDPFDGPSGTLAHAYFPRYGGDVHMDDSEEWTGNSYQGTNFLQTLTHEIGHSLGLSHSRVSASVMAPFYRGWNSGFKLHADDIRGVQSLYGQPAITTKPPIVFPTAATTTNRPIWPLKKNFSCPDFDTNTQGREGAQRIDGIKSWSACSLKCSKNKDCKYWTWHHEKATGFEFRCVLMSDFVVKAEDSNTISGSSDCNCPMIGINTQARQNANMIGLESSWQGCAGKCSRSTKCSHWTWHPDSAGEFARRCVHMSGYANLAEDENTVSGSKNCS